MRIVYMASLVLFAALMAVQLAVLLQGMEQLFRATRSLVVSNRMRFRSQVMATDAYTIQLFADRGNSTAVFVAGADLVSSLGLLDVLLDALKYGNASLGIDVPVQNAASVAAIDQLQLLAEALEEDVSGITAALATYNGTAGTLPEPVVMAVHDIIACQELMLTNLNTVNAVLAAASEDAFNHLKSAIVGLSIAFFLLIVVVGGAIYWPLDRQLACVRPPVAGC